MPHSCSGYGCTNRHITGGSVQFHRFPLCNPDLLKKWLTAVRRKGFEANTNSRLCSDHFLENDYIKCGQRRALKSDAVPSVFPEFPSYYQPKPKVTRNRRQPRLPLSSVCVPENMMDVEVENNFKDASAQTKINATQFVKISRKIKTLQQKVNRQKRKIKTLTSLLQTCKNKGLLESNAHNYLIQQFDGLSLELFKNQCINGKRNSTGVRFSEEIKKFAITLHYHSPRAYRYCRKFLKLPHEKSIGNWISGVNAEPGFFGQVFEALSRLRECERDCNLVLDGMAIRKQIIWDPKSDCFTGFSDYGQYLQAECPETPATEVLTFMLVSLTGAWKWPIGYFLHNKCTGDIQAQLIKTAIALATEAGLRVWGVTCDGTSTNFSTMINLGCKTYGDISALKSNFEIDGKTTYFIPDACHMLKLARNALGSARRFVSEDGVIDWIYIQRLYDMQDNLKLKFANRLSKTHIEWEKNKMRVKFAAQTLSSSVADALTFLKDQGVDGFEGCDETIKFIKVIDRLFDFLNTRSPLGKGYKKPIYVNDLCYLETQMTDHINYLFKLKDTKGTPIYSGPKKTFVLGFGLTVQSVLAIAKKLLVSGKIKYLLTYKFSQDHLELLFSRIRKRYGSNNNPNVLQLKSAFKKILLKNDITPSVATNCLALDDDPARSIFEIKWHGRKQQEENVVETFNTIDDCDIEVSRYCNALINSNLRDNILYYISGYLVRKISPVIDCVWCKETLLEPTREHSYCNKYTYSRLINIKNRGGLVSPSQDVFMIVKQVEKEILLLTDDLKNLNEKNIRAKVSFRLMSYLICDKNVFKDLCCEEGLGDKIHRIELVKIVINMYCRIRLFSLSKIKSEEVNTVSKRHKLCKTVLFMNQ